MTNSEIQVLVDKYFDAEGYTFPTEFEHRFDPDSSAILYSLLRLLQPRNCLAVGTWEGGSTCVIMAALLKNGKKFKYTASELLDDKRLKTEANCLTKNGKVPVMIGDITKNLDKVPSGLDFLFLDHNHERETAQWIFDNIFPRLKDGAFVAMHDWAVWEEGEQWVGKGPNGTGGWPETELFLELHREGKLPLEKIYWLYKNRIRDESPDNWEGAFWHYKKLK